MRTMQKPKKETKNDKKDILKKENMNDLNNENQTKTEERDK